MEEISRVTSSHGPIKSKANQRPHLKNNSMQQKKLQPVTSTGNMDGSVQLDGNQTTVSTVPTSSFHSSWVQELEQESTEFSFSRRGRSSSEERTNLSREGDSSR